MSKLQPRFPSYNRTPKHLGCLNTLHPNHRDEFRTCWGRVEELLVAEELWNDHKKLIFFPVASTAICTDSHLEVDQRDEFRTCWGRVEELLVAEELWNDHKKFIFFPVVSAATCTDSHLEVDQRSITGSTSGYGSPAPWYNSLAASVKASQYPSNW
ncbi:hypothetical protein Taro_037442 [Colocasia esculenta]|uniref:Uncharacterized protein n=1 Tax=Colocasia esculenta TaxID=4460 RepID=A0A843W5P2_COLES|nr:hypothetical protein [Colocasia esculenta]